jgi:serine/threonine protein kinase
MSLFSQLAGLALKGVGAAVEAAAGVAGAGAAVEATTGLLAERFTDHSAKLTRALDLAHKRAWSTVELCLAGRSWWESAKSVLNTGTERAFRDQVQAFLDANPLDGIDGHGPDFRAQCLAQLASARKAGLLDKGKIDPRALAEKVGGLSRFGDPSAAIAAEFRVLDAIAAGLRKEGYDALADFLGLRPAGGPPLLVAAMRFHFQREVEKDDELFQGLAYARLEALEEGQRKGFGSLAAALDRHAEKLEGMLADIQSVVVKTHGDVLDIKAELARQGRQMQELGRQVLQALEQRQLQARELHGADSLSIRDDDERRLVRELVKQYRSLPANERRRMPALLNAVGKLEVVSGEFEAAERDFQEARGLVDDPKARAEVDYNSYRASLERRGWDEAMRSLRSAAAGDPERFSPFPMDKYEPERILGAGGFGVAFLCRNKNTGGRVVIKTLHREGMSRSVDEVFKEAQALEGLEHPAIIRVRDCDYAGPNRSRPYFVMDFFPPGQTLEDLVNDSGPLKPEEVLPVARLLAQGLQSAHSRGILHRDIKPGNVLVRRGEGGSWEVKLIDFGLAVQAQPGASTARSAMDRTLVGSSVAGTLEYAAPEQMGKLPGVAVGTWSDVYGWGRTVCFALFGTPQPTFQHWQQVKREVAALLGRCLHEKPGARPQTFSEVLKGLGRLSADDMVDEVIAVQPARPEPRPEPRREYRPEPRREPRRERVDEVEEAPPPKRGGGAGMFLAVAFLATLLACGVGGFFLLRNVTGWNRPPFGGFPGFGNDLGPFTEKPITAEELPKVLAELRGKVETKRLANIAHQMALTDPTAEQRRRHAAAGRLVFDQAMMSVCAAARPPQMIGLVSGYAMSAIRAEADDELLAVSKGLNPLLNDAHYGARKEVVLALRKWGTAENVPTLAKILDDGQEGGVFDFRIDVAKTLAAIGDPRGIPAVAKRLEDTGWDLRRGIIQVVQEFGPAAEDETLKYLDAKQQGETRKAAVLVLEKIGGKKSLEALKKLEGDKGMEREVKQSITAIEKRLKK